MFGIGLWIIIYNISTWIENLNGACTAYPVVTNRTNSGVSEQVSE